MNIGRNTWINQDDIVFEKLRCHHQQLWTRSEHTTEPAEPQSPLTTNGQTSPSEDGCIEVDSEYKLPLTIGTIVLRNYMYMYLFIQMGEYSYLFYLRSLS